MGKKETEDQKEKKRHHGKNQSVFDGFQDGRREVNEPRHAERGKGKEMDSSLEPPERTQPCQHLNYNPVRHILSF